MKLLFKILLVLFLLLPIPMKSQTIVTHQNWQLANEGQWGSFWWKVNRTETKSYDGNYYYYIICYSSSYFNTMNRQYGKYDRASTYVEYPKIVMWQNGNLILPLQLNGALFDYEETQIAYFYFHSKNVVFTINYNAVYPFDYSLR